MGIPYREAVAVLSGFNADRSDSFCPSCKSGTVRIVVRDRDGTLEISTRHRECECEVEEITAAIQRRIDGIGTNGRHAPEPAVAHGQQWDEPLPLGEFEPPKFPLEILPVWVREMAEAVGICLSIPVDAAAMFTLACLSTACQKRVVVKIRDGWVEPLTLWVLIAMPPANRKSPLFRQLLAPIVEYQLRMRMLSKGEIAVATAHHRMLDGRQKRAEQAAIKAKSDFERDQAEREAVVLAQQLANTLVPAEPRLIVNDATPEKLGDLLHKNGSRMAVMSPEGDCFEQMAGKYSNGQASLGLYLAGHSGDDWTVDRIGREGVELIRTAITFGLTVQPDVLSGFAAKPQFRGRGLLGRFLYCVPETMLGFRPAITPAVLERIEQTYAERLTSLLSLPIDLDADGIAREHVLLFDPDASQEMAGLQDWIEPKLGTWGELRSLADWAGKLAGACARTLALLHLAELAEVPRPWTIPVAGEELSGIRKLAEYLIAHSRIAFQAMAADVEIENARYILAWLKDHPVGRFSRRNLHRRLIRRFETVEQIERPLALLVERGYFVQIAVSSEGRPGPRPVVFDVHPKYAGEGGELEG